MAGFYLHQVQKEDKMNTHPFLWLQDSSRKTAFWVSTALALLTMLALQALGASLKTEASPSGIVSFELAGSLANIATTLTSWDPTTRIYAGLNLGLDYLFIGTYVGAIGLGCVLVAESLSRYVRPLGTAGVLLAWGILLAGILDCVENYALIKLLLGSQANILAVVARFCAIPKFLIVLFGLLYVILGAMVSPVLRRRSRQGALDRDR
jgi:hypothetical protein